MKRRRGRPRRAVTPENVRAVEVLDLARPGLSNAAVGKLVGVSGKSVGRIRAILAETAPARHVLRLDLVRENALSGLVSEMQTYSTGAEVDRKQLAREVVDEDGNKLLLIDVPEIRARARALTRTAVTVTAKYWAADAEPSSDADSGLGAIAELVETAKKQSEGVE